MARRGPLSAAHRAAISRGLKAYHAKRKGGSSSGNGVKMFQTDRGTMITREEAARIMFGSSGKPFSRKRRGR